LSNVSANIADEKILELLQQQGQPSDMERGMRMMMDKYQERLFATIFKLVGNAEDAADVLQNCFIKAYRAIGSFERKAKLYTWLYRIATNESFTFLRKKKKTKAIGLEEVPAIAAQMSSNESIEEEKIQSLLQKAIDTLPEKQQMVFMLRYYDEMPYEQMAKQLDSSVGGLKASYHHAVKKVETYLKESDIF